MSENLRGLDAESREMAVETVRQLKKRLLTPEQILAFDRDERFPEAAIREMLGPEIGLQLLFIPEEYGGMGGGARDCCAITREMSKICLGVATAFFAIQLGADPLLVGGTDAQKEKWLGAIAEGDCLVAYAVTEPEAGSNLAALRTQATPVPAADGGPGGYQLNGTKQFISNGGYADFVTVLAKTPDGPSFFVVEKGAKGFIQGKGEEKHGIRASNTSPLIFEELFVPAENLIGETPGKGMKQANQVFGYTRLMVAAMALGGGEAALDRVIPYARERIQFGSPLSEKQGYTHKLVIPHVVRLEAGAAYMEAIAERLDGENGDLQVEGSIAKFFLTEAANDAADDAMQALGGYGYIREFEVEKIKRDLKITCIYEGTSEIQQSIISTFRWKSSRKSKGAFYESMAQTADAIHERHPDMGADHYALAARALNQTINLVHEHKLTRQQAAMFALADMMTQVEVGLSLLKKTQTLCETGDRQAERYRLISRIFASEVARMVGEKLVEVLMGGGLFNVEQMAEFGKTVALEKLIFASYHRFSDMDRLADWVFERAS